MNDQQATQLPKFRTAIQNSVARILAVTNKQFELTDTEHGTGAEFLNAFSREIGLTEADYFSAYYVMAKGAIGDDTAAVITQLVTLWSEPAVPISRPAAGLVALLDQDGEFRSFIDSFIDFTELNPYDYATAKAILDSGSNHQVVIDAVRRFWQTIFDEEVATSPQDLDLTNPTSLIVRVSANHPFSGLTH